MNTTGNLSNISSSNVSSGQYSILLSTVSELKNDLEKALNNINQIENENKLLKNNYDLINNELNETKQRYKETRENYLKLLEEKLIIEKSNESFINKISQQLKQKTEEFELQREKLKPQDIGSIRLKLQEELEIPHKVIVQRLNNEIDKFKDLYYKMKNELELTKTDCNSISINQIKQINSLKEENNHNITLLNNRIKQLIELQYDNNRDNYITSLEVKIHELSHTIDTLKDEVITLRKDKDDLTLSNETNSIKFNELVTQLKARIIVAESDKYAIDERYKRSQLEYDRLILQSSNQKQLIEELNDKLNDIKQYNNDLIQDLNNKQIEYNQTIEKINYENSNERIFLENSLNAVNSRLLEREETIRKLQKQINEIQEKHEHVINELRRSNQNQLQEVNKRYISIENELLNKQKEYNNLSILHNTTVDQNKIDIDILKSDNIRIKREKDILHNRIRDLENNGITNNNMTTNQINELKNKILQYEKNINENKMNETKLNNELNNYVNNNQLLISTNSELKQQINDLNVRHSQLIDKLTTDHKSTIDKIQNQNQELFNHQITKLTNELNREKKKSEVYKEKAIAVHNRNKELFRLLSNNSSYDDYELVDHSSVLIDKPLVSTISDNK